MTETITSRQNPFFIKIRKLRDSNSFRRKEGLFLGEGPKLLEEALRWGADLKAVVTVQGTSVPDEVRELPDCRLVETPADVLASLSDTETPQGVVFLCSLRSLALPERLEPGRYLVLDGVQDPGNLGTIWRTADAMGASGLILTGSCADPFSPKVIRSTMGACFRSVPIWKGERTQVKEVLTASGIPLYATALREDTEDIRTVELGCSAVVIGSEGRGISDEMLALSEKALKIPMESSCESLNAAIAATIVLWEGSR